MYEYLKLTLFSVVKLRYGCRASFSHPAYGNYRSRLDFEPSDTCLKVLVGTKSPAVFNYDNIDYKSNFATTGSTSLPS